MIENKKVVPRDKSIRLNLLISNSDIGFEALYQQLVQFKTNGQRSKFVKTFLHDICVGVPTNLLNDAEDVNKSTQSLRIDIRFSKKEIGFEVLHAELNEMTTTFERNQHVRRMVFNVLNLNFQIEKRPYANLLTTGNSENSLKTNELKITDTKNDELVVLSETDSFQKTKERDKKRKKMITDMLLHPSTI